MTETPLSLAARSPLRDPLAPGPSAPLIPRLTMQSPGVIPLVRYTPTGPGSVQPAIQPSPGFSSLPEAPAYFDPLQGSIGSRFSGLSREPLSQYIPGTPAATAIRVERPLSPTFEESPNPFAEGAQVFFGSRRLANQDTLSPAEAKARLAVRLQPEPGLLHSIMLVQTKDLNLRILYLTVDIAGKDIKTGVNLVRYQPPKDPAAIYHIYVLGHGQRLAPLLANRALEPEAILALVTSAGQHELRLQFQVGSRWATASDQEILNELHRRRLPLKAPISRENFLQQLWASEP